jgi:hypothetical protein
MDEVMALVLDRLNGLRPGKLAMLPFDEVPAEIHTDEFVEQARLIIDWYHEGHDGHTGLSAAKKLAALKPVSANQRHYHLQRSPRRPAWQPMGRSQLEPEDDVETVLYLASRFALLNQEIRPDSPVSLDPYSAKAVKQAILDFYNWVDDTAFPCDLDWVETMLDDMAEGPMDWMVIQWYGFDYIDEDRDWDDWQDPYRFLVCLMRAADEHDPESDKPSEIEQKLYDEYGVEVGRGANPYKLGRYFRQCVPNLPKELEGLPDLCDYVIGNTGWGWLDVSEMQIAESGQQTDDWTLENFLYNKEIWQNGCLPIWERVQAVVKWILSSYGKPNKDNLNLLINYVAAALGHMQIASEEGEPLVYEEDVYEEREKEEYLQAMREALGSVGPLVMGGDDEDIEHGDDEGDVDDDEYFEFDE